MMTQLLAALILVITVSVARPAAAVQSDTPSRQLSGLTLEQAMAIAETLAPELAEARFMVDAAEARASQAGTFPNPEAVVGAQQLPLNDQTAEEKEYVAGIAQTVPLSRRLSQARRAELLDREVRARGLDVKRRDLEKRVHSAFATALYQEQALEAQKLLLQNVEKILGTTQARVEAGDALPEDVARVEMELARTRVEASRAETLRKQALITLASAMGDSTLVVSSLSGTLEQAFDIPAIEELAAGLSAQPDVALAAADVRARSARVDLARSERIPDIRVEALYHRLEASKSDTIDIGLTIPLPLFNRNQGRIGEAQAELKAAEARARITQNDLARRLRESHAQLLSALDTTRMLKGEVLTRADKILQSSEARYAAGDIGLSELLPVRRQSAEIQIDYLESLREVVQAWAELKPWLKYPDSHSD